MKKNDEVSVVPDGMEQAHTSLDRIVPKFCTSIDIAPLSNKKNVVLSMLFKENIGAATLIERVIVDVDHLAQLRDVLGKVLEDMEYVSDDSNSK